ncbi:cytochrome P450 [Methyloceanibacter sp.]|uniref:cytochrome P450 n=1 Tax=Methyloceanibacter sp. TaxID=1965321 RepID=UPI003D6D69D7
MILRLIGNPIAAWSDDFYDKSTIYYRWLGIETLFVMEPELIQTVLLDAAGSFSKQPLYDDVLGEAIGGGLLNAEGEEWRWQRRLAAPLFRPEDVLDFVPAFAAACGPVLARWREGGDGTSQKIDQDMARATLQVLQDTVLGAHLTGEDRDLIEQAGSDFLAYSVWKLALTSLRLPPSLPHPGARVMARAGQTLRQVAGRVLARTRASGAPGNDLLGRLVTARDPATGEAMPDDLLVDNVVTFLMAGHETTAQALTWTLYLLALFPEWQERVREEGQRVVGNGVIGREHLAQLPLMDGVFQEAMRLYPPAPNLMRRTLAPVTLGDHALSAGATIMIPIYVVHRHRNLWRDPLAFDPSRFTAEARAKRHRCAYMPFSTGPRSCIGASFAFAEGKAMLATLLAGARFALPDGEAPTPLARITLRPEKGLTLKVTPL